MVLLEVSGVHGTVLQHAASLSEHQGALGVVVLRLLLLVVELRGPLLGLEIDDPLWLWQGEEEGPCLPSPGPTTEEHLVCIFFLQSRWTALSREHYVAYENCSEWVLLDNFLVVLYILNLVKSNL